ncbi:unnamed protein product [Amoebophrya sp. A25]|nr:unnamed protein product [Amoebophrya sp. A25]|eukprot:GSA25T00018115001.1
MWTILSGAALDLERENKKDAEHSTQLGIVKTSAKNLCVHPRRSLLVVYENTDACFEDDSYGLRGTFFKISPETFYTSRVLHGM